MKLNECIMRILDWPIQQAERLRDWLEAGDQSIYDARATGEPEAKP